MAYCNEQHDSYFEYILKERQDFRNQNIHELSVDELKNIDPVGYNFFRKIHVQHILEIQNAIHPNRYELRDVLKMMDDIWRFNSVGRQVLNEHKYITPIEVENRTHELLDMTLKKFERESRVENEVTSGVVDSHEFYIPPLNPTHTSGKLSSANKIIHTGIQPHETPPLFQPMPQSESTPKRYAQKTQIF